MNVEKSCYEHYLIERRVDGSFWELGRSPMGITYKSLDVHLQCPVALKVLDPEFVSDERAFAKFFAEARGAARLRHRNVVSVLHLGVDERLIYLVTEFIEGESMEDVVRRSGPLRPSVAMRVGMQVAAALNAAARQGLVHRDLRPANILLLGAEDGEGPVVKVLNFGLAQPDAGARMTDDKAASGASKTLPFASPEQVRGRPLDLRSNLYSLGCTLWYLLTGFPPFMGAAASVTMQQVDCEPPLDELRALPRRLRRLLERLLAKDPEQRLASPLEVRCELERCLAILERKEALAASAALLYREPGQWVRKRSRAQIVGALCALPLLALGVGAMLRTSSPPARELAIVPAPVTEVRAAPGSFPPISTSFELREANVPTWSFSMQPVAKAKAEGEIDRRFIESVPPWPDLGTPDAPFWSAEFLRRRLVTAEVDKAIEDASPLDSTFPVATSTKVAGLWLAGTPDPFLAANPRFGRGRKPFSARLVLSDRHTEEVPVDRVLKIASGEHRGKAISARKRSSRRAAKRDGRFDPIASLTKVHRSLEGFVRRLF